MNDIIILGPTSSGKSLLAEYIAVRNYAPIFNCDSVQIYKDLNLLSNKPDFIKQEVIDGEVVSFTAPVGTDLTSNYENFIFTVITKKGNKVEKKEQVSIEDVLNIVLKENTTINTSLNAVKNYLFDIKNPAKPYSLAGFTEDIKRISQKDNFTERVVAGGTIYYGYHHIFGTKFGNEDAKVSKSKQQRSKFDLLKFLQEKDPQYLEIVDKDNIARLTRAVEYIESSGEKFSENYNKGNELLENFTLILIYPKDRSKYVENLNTIVRQRMIQNSFIEIPKLLENYGNEISAWLNAVSYEYKYALKLWNLFQAQNALDQREFWKLKETVQIIEELQAKERQYTKRQVTFMRKLEKELSGLI